MARAGPSAFDTLTLTCFIAGDSGAVGVRNGPTEPCKASDRRSAGSPQSQFTGALRVPLSSLVENEHLPIDLKDLTYYVGHEKLEAVKSGKMGKVAEAIFTYLQRNAVDVESTFCLPPQQFVEISTQVDV